MRDCLSLNLPSFNASIENILLQNQQNFLRTSALINPNRPTEFENRFIFKDRSLRTFLLLAISSWYCDEEIGVLLRLQISEEIKNNEDIFFLELALISKASMLIFLQESSLWHSRDFFGNILTKRNLQRAWKSLRPVFKSNRRPRRLVRRRGYKDKGSLRETVNIYSEISLSRELKEEELRKFQLQSSLSFLEGFFLGG